MMIRYLLLLSFFTLGACQTNNLVELDYQPGHNYQAAQSWQWAEPAVKFVPDTDENKSDLDAARLRQAVTQQLLQQGLNQNDTAPIQVRAWLIRESQQQRTDINESHYWGPMWGPSIRTESYEITQHIQKLQIDILDSTSQKLIWRGSDSWVLPQQRISPEARETKLRQQVQNILQHFPPL
ncbi:MAG TPA: DUF4136 domain-containing protein [Thiopseudomonas sp.]|nr:DUF4136 domain-containing protein [Thiopseudomonas sp.]